MIEPSELDLLCIEIFSAHPVFQRMSERDRELSLAIWTAGWDAAMDQAADALRQYDATAQALASTDFGGVQPQ
jgi:hypothetical protein